MINQILNILNNQNPQIYEAVVDNTDLIKGLDSFLKEETYRFNIPLSVVTGMFNGVVVDKKDGTIGSKLTKIELSGKYLVDLNSVTLCRFDILYKNINDLRDFMFPEIVKPFIGLIISNGLGLSNYYRSQAHIHAKPRKGK